VKDSTKGKTFFCNGRQVLDHPCHSMQPWGGGERGHWGRTVSPRNPSAKKKKKNRQRGIDRKTSEGEGITRLVPKWEGKFTSPFLSNYREKNTGSWGKRVARGRCCSIAKKGREKKRKVAPKKRKALHRSLEFLSGRNRVPRRKRRT